MLRELFKLPFKLIGLPFKLGFGFIRLGLELFFGLFNGVFGLVFGVLGLLFGLFKGLLSLVIIGAIIAFIAGMFNRGYRSGSRQQRPVSEAVEEFQSFYHQNVR